MPNTQETRTLTSTLPSDLQSASKKAAEDWQQQGKLRKLWDKDASLWTNDDEADWLGWLDIVERQQDTLESLRDLANDIRDAGFESALLLGMGGSSLCAEVLATTFGRQKGFPALQILDSTDPTQIRDRRRSIDLEKTIFIVSSKSGSTLETGILKQYFYDEALKAVGEEKAGSHFIAITDPGSKLERIAKADKFRHIVYGDPQIGGRDSALSNFGMVVAAVMGLDVKRLLEEARRAVDAAKNDDPEQNPALQLGLLLGTAANAGHDKLTFLFSPELRSFGASCEQLVAESTGKYGKGITPVDRENIAAPDHYGKDRLFVYFRLEVSNNDGDKNDDSLDRQVEALEKAGQPVVRLAVQDLYGVAPQWFLWQIATAVASAVLGVNAFNQPDFDASKQETRRLLEEYEDSGKLEEPTPLFSDTDDSGIAIFAAKRYAATLGDARDFDAIVKAHLDQIRPGDYFATLAYLNMTRDHEDAIQYFRHQVRGAKKVATCLGFGSRFLHSTGQDYKGGPNTGVFLHLTADPEQDIDVPGHKYAFGTVLAAQAAGDLIALQQRDRRILRVHLGKDIAGGLKRLATAVQNAL